MFEKKSDPLISRDRLMHQFHANHSLSTLNEKHHDFKK